MSLLESSLKKQPIFYITRDIERAIFLIKEKNSFIITNSTEYSKKIAQSQENILLIESEKLLDTLELMQSSETQAFLATHARGIPQVLVFKNTEPIERCCEEKAWNLLNPKATLSKTVEEKISQVEWLGPLTKYLPPHSIILAKEIQYDETKDMPFILQFNRAHTGLGTMFIDRETQLKDIQNKFPNRPVRKTKFIARGAMFTSNNVVTPHDVLVGNISYQITGILPFTENPFATIGNDWKLPHKILKPHHIEKYNHIVKDIGDKLRADGWKGLFGVDVIYDFQSDDIFLIEINARQPASTTYESQLQMKQKKNEYEITTGDAHVAILLDSDIQKYTLISINDGAQIIQRVTSRSIDKNQKNLQDELLKLDSILNVISYDNMDLGSDWIRIQLSTSIMEQHNTLNKNGLNIQQILDI